MPAAAEHVGTSINLQHAVALGHDCQCNQRMLVTGNGAVMNAIGDVVAVGRIGDNKVNAFIRQLLEEMERVAANELVTGKR